VNLRTTCLLMSIATAACAAHAQGVSEGPQPTREALSARPIPWKTGSLDLVPTTILHLQVIITPGFERGQHFAWFTRGGKEVVVVFSASTSDVDEMSDELNGRYIPEQGVPGDNRSFVIFGTYKGPGGPPPPDPGGFPIAYVELVMQAAFDTNVAQVHADQAAAKF
jgi:hypothetical protein